ncbi:membrane protein [Kribbella yunnanensis]|uniref:Membrane protein n=1 Tax=Kribbella yunnanensis TaxID=190194 RepID=A0ABP4UW81_9ACTN
MTAISPALSSLRRLYFVRAAFALLWAVLVGVTGAKLGPVSVTLVVLYPLFDVGAAIVDARASKQSQNVTGLYINIIVSLAAAAGLALATATSGIPGVLRVWGAWAIVSGIVQLIVGVGRRKLGGQWPMIVSGGLSVGAGSSFILMSGQPTPALTAVAGYAALGGIFFLISAIRLGAAAKKAPAVVGIV